jgi:hypothetical protein
MHIELPSLQATKDGLDVIFKIASIVAVLAGGWWTWHIYSLSDAGYSAVEVAVTAESVHYGKDTRLLIIHVKPRNVGKVPINAGKDGLVLTVRKIANDLPSGHVKDDMPPLFHGDIVKEYDGYELEPGVGYDEVHSFVVEKGYAYSLYAYLDLGIEKGSSTEVSGAAVVRVD